MSSDLRRRQVMYPKRSSYLLFQVSLFYKEEKVEVRGLELRKWVNLELRKMFNQVKAAVQQFS